MTSLSSSIIVSLKSFYPNILCPPENKTFWKVSTYWVESSHATWKSLLFCCIVSRTLNKAISSQEWFDLNIKDQIQGLEHAKCEVYHGIMPPSSLKWFLRILNNIVDHRHKVTRTHKSSIHSGKFPPFQPF